MNICRKCGAVLRDGDKYCSKCGARSPSIKARERKENAQKRKQEKKITFQTKPENTRGYRENFEEGENRSRALLVTVTILIVMMLAVAAFAMFYFMNLNSKKSGSDYSSAIQIIGQSEALESSAPAADQQAAEAGEGTQAAPESAAPEAVPESGTQEPEAAPVSEAQEPETAPASEAQESEAAPASEAQESEAAQTGTQETEASMAPETEADETETETAPETERSTPSASDVIDPAQIQSILDSESTASSAEVYIYDLKHDSEAALNDCTQPMYASALITVPILYTAASRIDAGQMTLDDPIPYVTSIGGRGEMTTEQRDGLEFPLSFYLQTMVNYSDNNCINVLIDYIGLDQINAVCQEAGYTSVNLERGLVAGDPGGLDNYVSAKDITMMVKDLYTGAFTSIGTDFMKTYFHISEGDSLPTLAGLAPGLQDASYVLNQNGHGMTRYNETAVIEDNGALYILTIMLYGDSGMVYSPAVTDVAEYVSTAMAG